MKRFLALAVVAGAFFIASTANAAVSVSGKVTLTDGTTGVSNAWVNIHDPSWYVYQGVYTDMNGNFSFYDMSSCTCTLSVYANNSSYADPDEQTVSVTSGEYTDLGVIRLTNHNVIGTLKLPDGTTAATSIGVSLEKSDYTVYRWYTTDSSGQFRFRVPSTGTYTLRISSDFTSGSTTYYAPANQSVTVTDTAQILNIGNVLMQNPNVTGTVTEANGTTAISGASITARTANWSLSKWTTSASNGTFGFYLPAGSYTLETWLPSGASGLNPAPSTFTVTEGQTTALGAIRKASPNVFFKVTQSNGTTNIANASISVHNANWSISRYTNTASDGTASVSLPSSGTYTVEIWANNATESDPDPFTFTYSGTDLHYDDTTSPSSVIKLQAPAMRGIVRKSDGTNAQNTSLYLYNASRTVSKWASTDASGAFMMPSVATGTYTLQVTPPWDLTGYTGPDPIDVSLTRGTTDTTYQSSPLILSPAMKTIRGKVTRPDGTVVTNAYVNAWKNNGSGWANTTTNSSGDYSFTVGRGEWTMTVYPQWTGTSAPDWGYYDSPKVVTFSQANAIAESSTQDFTVAAFTATITGTAQNPNGTAPTGYNSVSIWAQNGGGNWAQLGADGGFSLKVAPGTYNVSIYNSNPQYGTPEIAPVTVKDGETKNIGTIKFLEKNETIAGTVTDSNSRAVASQYVSCWKPRGSGWASATTDATGAYSMKVSPGTWVCDAYPSFYSYGTGDDQIQYAKTQEAQEFTMSANETKTINFVFSINDATINGKVQNESGTTISDLYGWVQATKSNSSSTTGQWSNLGGNVSAGLFSIKVSAGSYNLGMWLPYGSGYTATTERAVTIASGETVNDAVISVRPNNVTLSGAVRDTDGNALTGVTGSVYATNGATGQQWSPITEGRYTMSLSAGEWNVGYWVDQRTGYLSRPLGDAAELTLTANETRTFDLTLTKLDATISGTVKDPDGNPLPNAWISIDTELGGKKKSSSIYAMYGGSFALGSASDSDGNFSIKVPSGSYFVSASVPTSFGYMNPVTEEVTVSATTSASLAFAFRRADGTISGSVTLDAGATSFSIFRTLSQEKTPAYISAWSANGGFTDIFTNNGDFTLNIMKNDTWHLNAVYTTGSNVYKSQEYVVAVDDTGTATQNMTLELTTLILPSAEASTFPSNITKVLELDDGMTLMMPQNSLSTTTVDVTVTATPEAQLPNQPNDDPVTIGYDLEATYASGQNAGQDITTFPQDVTVTLPYTEAQLTEAGVTEDALEPKYWDDTAGTWKATENVILDADANMVTFTTSHFTNFALVSSASGGVAPTITVTAPADNTIVMKKNITVGGTVTDPAATVTVRLNGGTAQNATVNSDGTFSATISNLRIGTNGILVNASNNTGSAEGVTRSITFTQARRAKTANRILLLPQSGIATKLVIADQNGTTFKAFYPFGKKQKSVRAIMTDLNGDGVEEILAWTTAGRPSVKVFTNDGTLIRAFDVFAKSFKKGIHILAADMNADGVRELIAYRVSGAAPEIRIYTVKGKLLKKFLGGPSKFRGQLVVTTADMNGDEKAELLVARVTKTEKPVLALYSYAGKKLGSFKLFTKAMPDGFSVLALDTNDDGKDEVLAASGANAKPTIRIFNTSGQLQKSFAPLTTKFMGGLNVSVGDRDGDGKDDIVVTAASKGGPAVQIFSADGVLRKQFNAFAKTLRGSFTTVTTDLNADGTAEILVAPASAMAQKSLRIFNGIGVRTKIIAPFGSKFKGGFAVSVNN